MNEKMIVFPRNISPSVEQLHHPPNNYMQVASTEHVWPFLLYLEHQIVHFKRIPLDQQSIKHLVDVGKSAQEPNISFDKPSWIKISNKLSRPTSKALRKNIDQRVGYKWRNNFLVKPCFTFGQQKVAMGTCHVFQTTDNPMLLYVLKGNEPVNRELRLFPVENQFAYKQYVMPPNGCYVLSENVTYIILAIYKCLFSIDIIEKNLTLPFPWQNPIKENLISLQNDIYDRSVATPHVEDLMRFCDDPLSTVDQPTDLIFQVRDESYPPLEPIFQFKDQGPSQASEMQYINVIMGPKKWERPIQITTPNFIKWYNKIKYQPIFNPKQVILQTNEDILEPLNLCTRSTNLKIKDEMTEFNDDNEFPMLKEFLNEPPTVPVEDLTPLDLLIEALKNSDKN